MLLATSHQLGVFLTAVCMPLVMLGQGWSVTGSTFCCSKSCWLAQPLVQMLVLGQGTCAKALYKGFFAHLDLKRGLSSLRPCWSDIEVFEKNNCISTYTKTLLEVWPVWTVPLEEVCKKMMDKLYPGSACAMMGRVWFCLGKHGSVLVTSWDVRVLKLAAPRRKRSG